jgi:NADPH-dependent 2,4-dienoyl-CoA reductase/sulfur reductase-like enzyme
MSRVLDQVLDIAIIGAGPAGLSVAEALAGQGLALAVIDEQPQPGGQVYRRAGEQDPLVAKALGRDYQAGGAWLAAVQGLADVHFHLAASLWSVERCAQGFNLTIEQGGTSQTLTARQVVLATGAMERPTPFAGWQLPGVMTLGAAQTLLKDGGLLPDGPFVLAGSGPLLYLFAKQMLDAGIKPQAVLHTGPRGLHVGAQGTGALGPFLAALPGNLGRLGKGLAWRAQLALSGVPQVFGVEVLTAKPNSAGNHLAEIAYRKAGRWQRLETSLLLVHDGVVPQTQMASALGCALVWDAPQACWRPQRDGTGRCSEVGIWLAGDAARILGAEAARLQGALMTPGLLAALDRAPSPAQLQARAKAQAALAPLTRLRRFLDAQYPPAPAFDLPDDSTLLCRCEAVTAGEIRSVAQQGCMGLNQARAFTRAGMGPCMGRQCQASIARVMAAAQGRSAEALGTASQRMPLKPVTLAQMLAGAPVPDADRPRFQAPHERKG